MQCHICEEGYSMGKAPSGEIKGYVCICICMHACAYFMMNIVLVSVTFPVCALMSSSVKDTTKFPFLKLEMCLGRLTTKRNPI